MYQIKEFKELIQIEFYCGKVFFIEEEKLEILREQLNTKKILIIQGSTVNASNFRGAYPVPSNPTYNYIISLPNSVKCKAMDLLRDHEKEKKQLPSPRIIAMYLRDYFSLGKNLTQTTRDNPLENSVLYALHQLYPNK